MYIRTKDGRILDFDKLNEVSKLSIDMAEEPIREADTIEELCDEFVCEWFAKKVNRYRRVYCRFKIGQSKELYRRDMPLPADVDFEIYAGIWVKNKGLIYVAKMDNEGKLVLI